MIIYNNKSNLIDYIIEIFYIYMLNTFYLMNKLN